MVHTTGWDLVFYLAVLLHDCTVLSTSCLALKRCHTVVATVINMNNVRHSYVQNIKYSFLVLSPSGY